MQILCRKFSRAFQFFLDFIFFMDTLTALVKNLFLILFFRRELSQYKEKFVNTLWITLWICVDKQND